MANASSDQNVNTLGESISIGFLDCIGNVLSASGESIQSTTFAGPSASSTTDKFIKYPKQKARKQIRRSRSLKSSSLDFWITRDSATASDMSVFQHVNVSSLNMTTNNQLSVFTLALAKTDQAVFVNIKPKDTTVSYLLAVKFGEVPVLTSTSAVYDSFAFLCTNRDLIVGPDFSFYLYFSSSGDNVNLTTKFSYGVRELDSGEYQKYCVNQQSTTQAPVTGNTTNFTANFEIRTYSSGCYYLDSATGAWISNGLIIQSDTTLEATHCKSPTLPKFGSQIAGSIIPLPSAIDFAYVFANAGFLQNITIYLTVIIMCSLYIVLFILCRIADKRDDAKCAIHLLKDNDPDHLYFYEVVVHTAARPNANTDSPVFINLSGSFDETVNRRLGSSKKDMKVFQRQSVDTFVLSVKK
jgi:hypothetical protein